MTAVERETGWSNCAVFVSRRTRHGTAVVFARNELIPITVPEPSTLQQAQMNKTTIIAAINQIIPVGTDSIVYVIAHADPDSKRFSGLKAEDWAEILGNRATFKQVKRIHLVGCHTAGEVKSAQQATSHIGVLPYAVTGFYSFAGLLHDDLKRYGIFTQVASYCSYVRISAMGEIRAGFDEQGSRTRHAEATKVVFAWDANSTTTRSMTFPH